MEEVIATAREMENASEVLERNKQSRVEILENVLDNPRALQRTVAAVCQTTAHME